MKRKLVIITLFCLYAFWTVGQNATPLFSHLSIQNGLSHSSIWGILQDSSGFLWIATQDGLNRYDGYNFMIFKNKKDDSTSIGSNYARSLCLAKDGTLWVGTSGGGLNKYNATSETFKRYKHDPNNTNSVSVNSIRCVYEDRDGFLWLGTSRGGLDKFDPRTEKFWHYKAHPDTGIANHIVVCIMQDSHGNIWAGTENGLSIINPYTNKIKNFYADGSPNTIPNKTCNTILQDHMGEIWVGTTDGLVLYDSTVNGFTLPIRADGSSQSLAGNVIQRLYEDSNGNLWIATGSGLSVMDKDRKKINSFWHNPANIKSLSNNNVNVVYEDNAGIIWVGYQERGMSKYDPNAQKFHLYAHIEGVDDGLPDKNVRSIYLDNDNTTLWLGYVDGGLVQYNRKTGKSIYYEKDQLAQNTVTCITRDRQNNLWLGTWNKGLLKAVFDGSTISRFEEFTTAQGLSNNTVQKILQDSTDFLWLATADGLNLLNTKTKKIQHIIEADHSLKTETQAIVRQKDGSIWVASWDGLYKVMPQPNGLFDVVYYQANPDKVGTLNDGRIISLHTSLDGAIWAGTFGSGLIKILPKPDGSIFCESFTEEDGLSNNVIYNILEDSKKQIWLSTNHGLSVFSPLTHKFTNYDETDGLQKNEFFWGAAYKSSSGEMFFGGTGGINAFFPQDITISKYKPNVVITSFKMFNKTVGVGNDSPLTKSIVFTKNIELQHDQNVISFDFAALHFSVPLRNKYAYKLDGFNNTWIFTDALNRTATYTNLDPGSYKLHVKATNSDGLWNEQYTTINIVVLPPIWATWWFRLLTLIATLALVYGWYRMRVARVHRQKEHLEILVKQRTTEILQKNEELEQQKEAIIIQASEIETKSFEIESQHEQIKSSIRYAQRIQSAILPLQEQIQQHLDFFVLFRPKDIVSGDFYWFAHEKDTQNNIEYIFIALADCSGHGVPGAFMSMIGNSLLNEIVRVQHCYEPSDILNLLNWGIVHRLQQEKNDNNDGMDIALCRIEKKPHGVAMVTYAGAQIPLFYISPNYHSDLQIVMPDHKSIGGYRWQQIDFRFSQKNVLLQQGDILYFVSDGFADQNSQQRKRFSKQRLRTLLSNVAVSNFDTQQEQIETVLDDFMGGVEQRDDITLVGIKI